MRRTLVIALAGAVILSSLGAGAPAQPTTIPFQVVRTVPHTQGYGMGLAWDRDTLWITEAFGNNLRQYDPYTGVALKTHKTPNTSPRDLTFDGIDLWVTSWVSPPAPSIFTIDPINGLVQNSFVAPFTGGKSHGLAWDAKGGVLWLGEEQNRIYKMDKLQWKVITMIPVPSTSSYNPRGLAWDSLSNHLWVGYQSQGLIRKHSPLTGSPVEEFKSPYAGLQQGLTWDGWTLWATGGSSKKDISQIDVTPPFLIMQGSLTPNTKVRFQMTRADGQSGNLFVVGWSGSGTMGFPVGSATIPLTFDNFTVTGLILLPFFSQVIDNSGSATTTGFAWPALPKGIPFWVCGVTLDQKGVVSVTEPFKYVSQ
jgi:hypothetical protein